MRYLSGDATTISGAGDIGFSGSVAEAGGAIFLDGAVLAFDGTGDLTFERNGAMSRPAAGSDLQSSSADDLRPGGGTVQVTFTGHAGRGDGGALWVGSDSTAAFASATQGVAFDEQRRRRLRSRNTRGPGRDRRLRPRRRPRLRGEHARRPRGAPSLCNRARSTSVTTATRPSLPTTPIWTAAQSTRPTARSRSPGRLPSSRTTRPGPAGQSIRPAATPPSTPTRPSATTSAADSGGAISPRRRHPEFRRRRVG